jgi:hypothetical protein
MPVLVCCSRRDRDSPGTNFGIPTDIETAPSGESLVVSLDHGAIYEISRRYPDGLSRPAARAAGRPGGRR